MALVPVTPHIVPGQQGQHDAAQQDIAAQVGGVGMQGQGREQALPFSVDAQADVVQRSGLFPAHWEGQPVGQRPPAAAQAVSEDEQEQGQGSQPAAGMERGRQAAGRRMALLFRMEVLQLLPGQTFQQGRYLDVFFLAEAP